ncbi:phosphodiesterase [Nocardia sp. CS682]|uniref:phosphodiesterase n=1 Tax=Nocardia sp. CS682 TaxID=1047172 RepID=UPI0010757F96|nr:phosphodiesterase [Nocardia sp. CS682]QBS42838.1 phosphodiesterase [Nocardia sp. CS682]
MTDLAASVVRSTFAAGAKLRHARVFHPDGLHLSGRLHAESEYEHLFGTGERAVIARLSKGAGTPGSLPDVLGLAFRVLDRHDEPWDFALATTGGGSLSKFLITPARGWVRARYGSLMPYRVGKTAPLWFFAEPDTGQPASASLAEMTEHLREQPISFTLLASGVTGATMRLAELTLRLSESADHRTDYFDPMLNHPDGVELLPKIVGKVREFAYSGSRSGRGEGG